MTKELAKTLATALVQFIDRERPEGTICCSNAECESIERMFEGEHLDIVEAFIKKKLTGLTEFEKCMLDFAKARDEYEFDSTNVVELNNKVIELTKSYSKKLLALAKKELFKVWNENMKDEYARGKRDGVTIGYNKAMKEYNESVAYHFPNMPVNPYGWGCDGTHCINPHGDCINCPKRYSSGETITTPNTSSGTLKAEG